MQLEAFRIQNYKRISDTGLISCRDLMAFVGKNEAGKSAIFRGLSKLNPSDGQKYDGLKEFPRRRYTDEFALRDWPVATGIFSLDQEERDELINICPVLKDIKEVEVSRCYSSRLEVCFKPRSNITSPKSKNFKKIIDDIIKQTQDLTAPDGKGEILGQMKQTIPNELGQVKKRISGDNNIVPNELLDQAHKIISTKTNEDWQKQLFDPIISPLQLMMEQNSIHESIEVAEKWIKENLPKFIYLEDYNVINSAIYIPTFVQQAGSNQNDPRTRTSLCLFKHVGLDIAKFANIGRHQPNQGENQEIRRQIDERAILASSASNAMTKKFGDWWDQHKHQFRYQIDGDYFRVWVSDEQDPSWIELEQRSAGMQYFFSFFLIFLVEAEGAHANSILLLDEPALHLHGTAQAKVVKFLEKLSKDNQTFYSTHSPFMVDVDHLENVRVVFEDEDGTTKVSEDVWPKDNDTLFPLQAALGYQLAQSLFISKKQIIVEGITDLWLFKAFDQAFAKKGKKCIRSDIVIVPSAGVRNLLPLAGMLIGHNIKVVAVLDGDEPARKEGKKLKDKLLGMSLFIGDFTSNERAELEDIFTDNEYISAVQAAYPDADIAFDPSEKTIQGIINKIEALFLRKELGKFEKWKPAAILRDRIVDSPEDISDKAYNIMDKIFEDINRCFQE
ncbi:MAG: AAA family ATPase [Porphyromonadaceae bacterium]|nr:AAA family ATPase [Porphyromonadaceae bacterium]